MQRSAGNEARRRGLQRGQDLVRNQFEARPGQIGRQAAAKRLCDQKAVGLGVLNGFFGREDAKWAWIGTQLLYARGRSLLSEDEGLYYRANKLYRSRSSM